MAWHPETGELWFTDNGRDMMGDDIPPEEVNRVTEAGGHYGYPYVHGTAILDPEFGRATIPRTTCRRRRSYRRTPRRSAWTSTPASNFGAEYANAIFIAEHGSWNRSSRWATA